MKKKSAVNLHGKLNLAQSAAFIEDARLVITHDSGPMHLAAAMKTSLVAIFGPTDPLRFAPPAARVVQDTRVAPPSYDIYGKLANPRGSLAAIGVDVVLKEALAVLKKK